MTGRGARRLWVPILAVLFLVLVNDCVNEFVQNDGPGFYAKAPHLLLVAACFGLVGGGLVWLVWRLPGKLRGNLLLSGWAVGNIALTACAILLWLSCGIAMPVRFLWELLVEGLVMLGVAGVSWFLFFRRIRKGDTGG